MTNKQETMRSPLLNARNAAQESDARAGRALLKFILVFVERAVPDPENSPAWFGELRECLLADGFQLTWTIDGKEIAWAEQSRVNFSILPTDAGVVPLESEIGALEAELSLRGYFDALNNYRQAVDNFPHNKEAANGQLRTALEDLVISLAKDKAGYVGRGNAGEGGRAIKHLVEISKALPERDGGRLLQGLWEVTHTNGPHPGQSTADEARMRMQMITAMMRFLLNHFPV